MQTGQPTNPALERAKAMWAAGDYDRMTRIFRTTASEDFVEQLNVSPPGRALDIGCGTGSSALPLARHGLTVTGLDLSARMLDVARAKARKEELSICFDEGVMEAMTYPDASFDVAISMFGTMFSSKPQATITEIARVLKPGGKMALANWTSGGFSMRMNRIFAAHLPPRPADAPPPFDWGDTNQIRVLLEAQFDHIETRTTTTTWSVDLPPALAADAFLETAGPPSLMLSRMPDAQRSNVIADCRLLWASENISSDPNSTVVVNEYLNLSASRKY